MHKQKKLKNGTQVVFVPISNTKAVTVLVLFPVGSRQEVKKTNGGSHFIEHMMFKGTRRRPNTQIISRELDAVGAEFNAFTGKDHTGYYVKAASGHVDLALDILSDMIFHSTFDAKEFERERTVIIEEIHMYEDNPIMFVEELFEKELFSGSTLGWRISGTRQDIEEMQRSDLVKYHHQHYRPSRMTIVIAGNLPEDIETRVKKYFGRVAESKTAKPSQFKNFQTSRMKVGPKLVMHFKDSEQVQCMLGFPGYGYGHKRLAAQTLLSIILGGNMSSRLFIQVRERRGLAYMVRAGVSPYVDVAAFAIHAGLKKDKVGEAITVILSELKKIKQKGIGPAELKRAKEFLKGKLTLQLEESNEVADFFGKQQLFLGKMESPDEKTAKIMKVTTDDVQAVAKDLFRTARLRAAMIGPFEDGKPFEKLLKV